MESLKVSDEVYYVSKMSGWGFDPDDKMGSCVHYFRQGRSVCGEIRRPDKLYQWEEIVCMNDGSPEESEIVFCDECLEILL